MYIQVVTVNTVYYEYTLYTLWFCRGNTLQSCMDKMFPLLDFLSVTPVPSAFHLFEGKEKWERFYSSLFMRVEWLGNQ